MHQAAPAHIPPGQEELAGQRYMRDANGKLTPLELVKPADKLKDEVVRDLVARAMSTSAIIAAFRAAAFRDVEQLVDLVAEQYGAKIGGAAGNILLQTFDGCMKVELQVQKRVTYGPELQVAKEIVDECLLRWGEHSGPEIRAIVGDAFNVDQQGKVNRNALLRLKKLDITDERWLEAMRAITDAETPDGTKAYIRFHVRDNPKAAWRHVSLDAATA